MLALEKEGAKLPSLFYLDTLREKPLGNVPSIPQTSITESLVPSVIQYITQLSSSHVPSNLQLL